MGIRAQKITALLFREIGSILRFESKDARFKAITITDIKMTSDLGMAKVYFTVDGEPAQVRDINKALNLAQGFFRSKLGERIEMRFLPELRFYFDEQVVHTNRLEQLFKEIRDEKKP